MTELNKHGIWLRSSGDCGEVSGRGEVHLRAVSAEHLAGGDRRAGKGPSGEDTGRESRLELPEATSDDSTIAKFIAKRGDGLPHVGMKVLDLPAAGERSKADGAGLVSEQFKTGAGRHSYAFVHPSSPGGVPLELVPGSTPKARKASCRLPRIRLTTTS
jgi:hypothetical protein